jgi:sugar-specific transcriptional regulator TrmB
MMDLPQQLKMLGLSEKEAQILEFLLFSGENTPSKIAQRLKINRTTVYDLLNNLAAKGLITKLIKIKKLTFQAAPPKYWVHYWDKQENQVQEQRKLYEKMLPDLDALSRKNEHSPRVTFYEGLDGIEQAILDSLDVMSNEIVGFSSVSQVLKYIPSKIISFYAKEKIRREIASRFVVKHSDENSDVLGKYKKEFYKNDTENKFTPKYRIYSYGTRKINNEIMVYDDKVMIINIVPPYYSAVLIRDKDISESQKAIFEIAWQVSKPI